MRAAIVLAAGASRRFGRADKLFAELHGEPLVLRAIRAAAGAPVARVIVVAGQAGRMRALVRTAGLRNVVVVGRRERGAPLSATVQAGIAALRPVERDVLVFLGDMPGIDAALPRRLIRAAPDKRIVRPRHAGTPGHPVLARGVRSLLIGQGDRGFRPDPQVVGWIAGGAGCVADVDRRRDLRAARRRGAFTRR